MNGGDFVADDALPAFIGLAVQLMSKVPNWGFFGPIILILLARTFGQVHRCWPSKILVKSTVKFRKRHN
jgi:hypothetical protein